MDRRRFVAAATAALATPTGCSASGSRARARLTLYPDQPRSRIATSFTGLSYETAQLSDPTFFSPENTALAGFVRRLGAAGTLRIGGNTSEFGVWTPSGADATGKAVERSPRDTVSEALGPDTGRHPARPRPITPLALGNLRGFLDLTGWGLIYGLNMGSESPQIVAEEAAFVARTMGDKLGAFQLCNEPDLFHANGLRPPHYTYAQFADEWRRFFTAVRQRVPQAPFGGPDTAFDSEWLARFAREFGHDVKFLSQHYYAEGPPSDPSMNIERLLSPSPTLEDELTHVAAAERDSQLPFRMTETNSCYGGGKAGVSDSFASALWGADLMYRLAAAGSSGINFHGGGYGWYTPIAGTVRNGFLARPLYYGMLLFAVADAGRLIRADLTAIADAPQLTAYGIESREGVLATVVFNKHLDRDVALTIDVPSARNASVIRLIAPRADDATDTTLGGSVVGRDGGWSPQTAERLAERDGAMTLTVPRASGALVTFA